jgi:hypothetical protein
MIPFSMGMLPGEKVVSLIRVRRNGATFYFDLNQDLQEEGKILPLLMVQHLRRGNINSLSQ